MTDDDLRETRRKMRAAQEAMRRAQAKADGVEYKPPLPTMEDAMRTYDDMFGGDDER